jgi:hypothetical protein
MQEEMELRRREVMERQRVEMERMRVEMEKRREEMEERRIEMDLQRREEFEKRMEERRVEMEIRRVEMEKRREEMENMNLRFSTMPGNRWEMSKNVKEETSSKLYSFDIEKNAKSVIMSVDGNIAGEIQIKMETPNGEAYYETFINKLGTLNWRKSFSISEIENQDKIGDWKCLVLLSNATGNFRITVQAN